MGLHLKKLMSESGKNQEVVQTDGSHPFANRTVLEGTLLKSGDYRLTAAGRPILSLELEHLSQYDDPEPALRLELRMTVVVVGVLAELHRRLPLGSVLRVTGRLNQKRWVRDGKVRWGVIELVACDLQVLTPITIDST